MPSAKPAGLLATAFQSMLPTLAYAPFLTEEQRLTYRGYDLERVVQWMTEPPKAYGDSPKERRATRDRILTQALEQALAHMVKTQGEDPKAWAWGNVHTADFVHPLSRPKGASGEADVFAVTPAARGGDGSGADIGNWD